ncbi:MAG: cyclic nucleotide-binding domain-containing protein [Deltaproteobacteria bacterium]|nr:cyclic nucleotide-binding domain-containing protein [Deltaproteobacteria bacterium]
MSTLEVSRLGDEAVNALQRGELKQALQAYLRLEQVEPRNAAWPRGSALVFRKFGQKKQEIEALARAARIFVELGDVLKATTVLKQILAIDPSHEEAEQWLDQLHAAAVPKRPTRVPVSRPVPTRSSPAWSTAPATPIDRLRLSEVMPGASQELPGVFLIPLEGEEAGTQDLNPRSSGVMKLPLPDPRSSDTTVEDAVLAVEQEVRAAETLKKVLPTTPLFSSIRRHDSFGALITHAKLIDVEKGTDVFHQGDKGDALYVVAEGTLGVIDEGPPRRGIAKLEEGAFFGEIALVTDQPRTATVTALTDATLIAVDRRVVNALIETDRDVLGVLLDFLKNRLAERLLLVNPLFSNLSSNDRGRVKRLFRFLETDPGAELMCEGRVATGLIVLLSGRAEVVRGTTLLGTLGPGDLAGEMSLVTEQPAMATVRATTKCFAIELPAAAFTKIVAGRPEAMSFVREVIERRRAQVGDVISASTPYEEGGVSLF